MKRKTIADLHKVSNSPVLKEVLKMAVIIGRVTGKVAFRKWRGIITARALLHL